MLLLKGLVIVVGVGLGLAALGILLAGLRRPAGDPKAKGEPLRAQTKDGLEVGLAVSVRYRLDVRRLDHVHANLPPVDEVVPPVVAAVFRQLVPNYVVREVFATKREELRASAE